ncbi:unnamed protein product [Didymodactylos carnosus]|uniref:PNPLA domain-containing protein n=1 Tax=Didymodactylos carnosus TaxID=1234261 RepID=A0A8S2TNP2_9BILA|nr:unnamed protein product [Didymodactylos carnosus]CAF4299747.1 unnamed protein product [Didymodactylos carnosus]
MQEILMCTTAAPTYFSPHSMVAEKSLYVERGVQANNPTMIAYVKAIQDYQLPRDKIVVLSVVTGDYVPDELGPNQEPIALDESSDDILEKLFDLAAEHFEVMEAYPGPKKRPVNGQLISSKRSTQKTAR